MSQETWGDEYYPTPAVDCLAGNAAAHSLLKWTGLRPENLARHGLRKETEVQTHAIVDGSGNWRWMTAKNCALCVHHMNNEGVDDPCTTCPLNKVLGHSCCDTDYKNSPYVIWCNTGDPEPMIAALEKASQL